MEEKVLLAIAIFIVGGGVAFHFWANKEEQKIRAAPVELQRVHHTVKGRIKPAISKTRRHDFPAGSIR